MIKIDIWHLMVFAVLNKRPDYDIASNIMTWRKPCLLIMWRGRPVIHLGRERA